MPRRKSLVKRVDVEVAKRARTCKFTKRGITKGETCLVVFEDERDRSNYSRETALAMVADARARLDEIESALNGE